MATPAPARRPVPSPPCPAAAGEAMGTPLATFRQAPVRRSGGARPIEGPSPPTPETHRLPALLRRPMPPRTPQAADDRTPRLELRARSAISGPTAAEATPSVYPRRELRTSRTAKVKDAGREATGAHKHARTRKLGRKISGRMTAAEREQRTCAGFVRDLAERLRTPRSAVLCGALLALATLAAAPSAQAAEFGFKPGQEGLGFALEESGGSPALRAGRHPYQLRATIGFEEGAEPAIPAADLKDLRLQLPSGLIGNPSVLTRCTAAQFATPRQSPYEESSSGESCPDKSQVGTVTLRTGLAGGAARTFGLFNLTAPPGVAAELGAAPFGRPLAFSGQVRNVEGEYGLDLEAADVPQDLAIDAVEIDVWGTPWDASHDGERGDCLKETDPSFAWGKCSVGPPKTNEPLPFLTLPASCQGPLAYRAQADSWQTPGRWLGDGATTPAQEKCSELHFQTTSFSGPTSGRASTATGFDFDLAVDQEGLTNPEGGITGPEVQRAVVSLPEGFTINPSMGAGLGVCTPAQYQAETSTSVAGEACPDDSKIGDLTFQSPLVLEPSAGFEQIVKGAIYLAQPFQNPFDALVGVYLVARAPNGIFVKVAGRLLPDPTTGRITALFEGLPQLPYTNLKVHFREGQRAPLATPAACGGYLTDIELTPWQDEAAIAPVVEHQDFEFHVTQGVGGGPCPAGGPAPFAPGAANGSQNSQAGAYSPFFLHLTRSDTEAEITRYSALLPPGLLGKIAGVPYCPDADIEAARRETGAAELEHPSCPAASQIGHTLAGYGLGGVLAYAPGGLYLSGPYHGAPLSITAIDSALVGPFDLGVIIVRSGVEVNPLTTQVSIDSTASDPIPHIIDGIPIHIRDIRVHIDRPQFTVNPTSCEAMRTTSTLTGSSPPFTDPLGQSATVSDPFQVSGCSSLGFRPKLSLKLLGGTQVNKYPRLRATVQMRAGDANFKSAAVALPHAEFLAQEHIKTVCSKRLFDAHSCPKGSIYGEARAFTPLLAEPMEGPVYLVSGMGHRLPDLVVPLAGPGGIAVDLDAKIDQVRGGMRATFEHLPDAPASKFILTLFGGKRGLLVNSANVCQIHAVASVRFLGQNNAGYAPGVPLAGQCKGSKKKKRKAKKSARKGAATRRGSKGSGR